MSENSDQQSQQTEAPAQTTQQVQSAKPEGLSEAFWDSEKNALKTEDLLKSYGELSQFKTETEARYSKRPESADKYALPDAKALGLPEGTNFEFDDKHPLLATAREAAFAAGMDQAGFEEKFLKPYVSDQLSAHQKAEETFQAEIARLGEKGPARITAVNDYLKGTLSEKQYQALSDAAITADAVEALESLIAKTKDATMKGAGQASGETTVTEEDLQSMMRDPKYWRDKDPAFISKVTDGFKKLYPNQVPTSH